MNIIYYVYKIENLCNNKKYIGCSKHGKTRFKQHRSLLNKNKHKNQYLQNSWNKYGEDNFDFIIVSEHTSEKDMLLKEIELIMECNDCYNIAEGGLGGDTTKNYTTEQKKSLSEKRSEIMKKRHLENGSELNNPFLNRTEVEREDMLKTWSECKKGEKNSNAKYFNKVEQIKNGVVIKVWSNVYEASKDGIFNRKYIINCANNKKSFYTHKGYEWKFID